MKESSGIILVDRGHLTAMKFGPLVPDPVTRGGGGNPVRLLLKFQRNQKKGPKIMMKIPTRIQSNGLIRYFPSFHPV
jgi:hypothetical protein